MMNVGNRTEEANVHGIKVMLPLTGSHSVKKKNSDLRKRK